MEQNNISFEFFPPNTPVGQNSLLQVAEDLGQLNPEFFSVTFGAAGTTRDRTPETVFNLQDNLRCDIAPHISCIGSSKQDIQALLDLYIAHDVKRLVVLRGDIPSGMGYNKDNDFQYANQLVEFIRETTNDQFHIEVGCYPEFHPQANDPYDDLENFQRKVASGADRAITQYFFNPDAYFRFVDECRAMKIGIDIIPGIMPITNFAQIARFSDMCGAEIPRWIRMRLEKLADDPESLRLFGLEVVTDLCETLIDNEVPGLHFYTLNKSEATLQICRNLGFA